MQHVAVCALSADCGAAASGRSRWQNSMTRRPPTIRVRTSGIAVTRRLPQWTRAEAPAHRERTATIRKAIAGDSSLSTNAHNVKIITVDGVVTLRGSVKTPAEKAAVAATAEKAKGVKRVDNQLEVQTK